MSLFRNLLQLIDPQAGKRKASTIEAELDTALETSDHALLYAEVLLMLEIAFADDHLCEAEVLVIKQLLQTEYGLSTSETNEILTRGRDLYSQLTSSFKVTRHINDHASYDQKLNTLEKIWHVCFADGEMDSLEEARVRQLSELLYVRHVDYIRLRNEVKQASESRH